MRRALAPLVACSALLIVPASGGAAAEPLSITATPGLTPAFSTGVSDYWLNCPDGTTTLTVNAPAATTVSVAGKAAKSGAFSALVPITVGKEFKWTVTTKVGKTSTSSSYYARCTPTDMPIPTVARTGPTSTPFYLINPGLPSQVFGKNSYIVLVDGNAVPIWWRTSGIGPLNPTIVGSTSIAIFNPTALNALGDFSFGRWLIWDFNGQLVGRFNSPTIGMDPHELVPLPNGRFLTGSYEPISPINLSSIEGPAQSTGYRGLVREISADGTVAWEWHANNWIATEELAPWVKMLIKVNLRKILVNGYPAFDLDHISSIEPDGDGFIVAFRHLDAVYRVKKATGAITWKLGGTTRAESLTVVGDPIGGDHPLGAPHDARLNADGTLSVLDDGLGWGRNPRVVRYRIDAAKRTATVVSIFTHDGLHGSNCCGSARSLANGNWVIDWGANRDFTETDSTGKTLLNFTLPANRPTYRAVPITDRKITKDYLRAAMDKSLTVK
jgi:hypothetical protein